MLFFWHVEKKSLSSVNVAFPGGTNRWDLVKELLAQWWTITYPLQQVMGSRLFESIIFLIYYVIASPYKILPHLTACRASGFFSLMEDDEERNVTRGSPLASTQS
jgi:hypothetical protein